MIKLLIALSALYLCINGCGSTTSDLATFNSNYRFGLDNVYSKATDNAGKGLPELYGTRNFRVVLKDTLFRGGKLNPKGNMNPMTEQGLINLCKAGFSTVVYLYSTNYNDAPKSVTCNGRTLKHVQIDPKYKDKELLTLIKYHIDNNQMIYTTCWNGWHNSGLISAYSLMQFCGWSNDKALAYWEKNVDGNNGTAYNSIRNRIKAFKPYPDLNISSEKMKSICFP